MSLMRALRAYHAILAVMVTATYASGEVAVLHALLGYGVAGIILGRALAALSGVRPLGLERFYPHFSGLTARNLATHPAISRTLVAAIATTLIAATVSGVMLDRGRTVGLAAKSLDFSAALADEHRTTRNTSVDDGTEQDSILGEAHEAVANLLMLIVGLHVAYVLVFKRPLGRFMLFLEGNRWRE